MDVNVGGIAVYAEVTEGIELSAAPCAVADSEIAAGNRRVTILNVAKSIEGDVTEAEFRESMEQRLSKVALA